MMCLALPRDIEKLTRDVKGVEKTVILVEQNPSKYSHIDSVCYMVRCDLQRELRARRMFINNTFNVCFAVIHSMVGVEENAGFHEVSSRPPED